MDSNLQLLKLQAASILQSCADLRTRFEVRVQPGAAGIDTLLATTRRNAAISLGALASEYLFGRSRPGSAMARTIVDARRKQRRETAAGLRVTEARSVVRAARTLVGGLEDPIDWRLRRHLETLLARADSAATWKGAISRTEGALRELLVYSPPTDPITLVRVTDRKFRFLIRERLEALGPNWWEERVPPHIRLRSGKEAIARGKSPMGAVDFLTFNDYGRIITDPANWEDAFGGYFGDKTLFESKLKTLRRIRNDIAHSRSITAGDRVSLASIIDQFFSRPNTVRT